MADTEVKASPSPGANESETRRGGPPSPSPSTAPASPSPDAPMRLNYVQPLPTTSSAYRAIANLNRGFEQDRRNLAALQEFNFFPEEDLLAWGNILGRLQADASLLLLEALHERLMNNALYYDRLCWVKERELEDPDDVLIAAERRKRELAAEQQRREQGPQRRRLGKDAALRRCRMELAAPFVWRLRRYPQRSGATTKFSRRGHPSASQAHLEDRLRNTEESKKASTVHLRMDVLD